MPKRSPNECRPLRVTPHFLEHPEGSVLIEFGDTKVICTASVETSVPRWMAGKEEGWVTAEYDMLPRATNSRKPRDSRKGKVNGRTQEISRLIGRSLRAAVDLKALGEVMITIDCDVIQADGGTRTASVTGGYIALGLAIEYLLAEGQIKTNPIKDNIAAISVGLLNGEPVLDLDYAMDSRADVDMNVVMTGKEALVEVQGTGEETVFTRDQLNQMLDLAFNSLEKLVDLQNRAIKTGYTAERQTLTA
jgi:ribonuclease PH